MEYRPRIADGLLDERLQTAGAVLIDGPKACGKTATASRRAASAVRLDVDEDARRAAAIDPSLVLDGDRPRLIDEWQLHPRVWDHVRRAVDDAGEAGQFLLTGSSTPDDGARRHSGAGRIATIRMRPMTLHELGASTGEVSLSAMFRGEPPAGAGEGLGLHDMLGLLISGGWPQQLDRPDPRFVVDYLEQIVNVDVNVVGGGDERDVVRRRDPDKVRACVASLARNVGTSAGEQTIATDAGLSREAVRGYLAALQRLLLVEDQPAFNVHLRSSRNLRTTPNRHFVDPSLATAALRTSAAGLVKDLNFAGLLFESMVVRDLRVLAQPLDGSVAYFRTDDHEIDAVVHLPDGTWGAVEVKLGGDRLIDGGAASLVSATASVDQERAGAPAFMAVITATGSYAYQRDDGVAVVPLSLLGP